LRRQRRITTVTSIALIGLDRFRRHQADGDRLCIVRRDNGEAPMASLYGKLKGSGIARFDFEGVFEPASASFNPDRIATGRKP
jgi:hypothetical protein